MKKERADGSFRINFKLTSKSNAGAIYHSVDKGILTVVVPKALPTQTKGTPFRKVRGVEELEVIDVEDEPTKQAAGEC